MKKINIDPDTKVGFKIVKYIINFFAIVVLLMVAFSCMSEKDTIMFFTGIGIICLMIIWYTPKVIRFGRSIVNAVEKG